MISTLPGSRRGHAKVPGQAEMAITIAKREADSVRPFATDSPFLLWRQ